MIAGIAILKRIIAKVKESSEKFFEGDITISKKDCWLIGAILILLGVAIGLINAPLTHGVNINIASGNRIRKVNGEENGNSADGDAMDAIGDGAKKRT